MSDPLETATRAEAVSAEDWGRSRVYALVARLLAAPPDDVLLEMLRRIEVPTGEPDNQMVAAWELVKQSAQRAQAEPLRDEYQELFIGIGRGELMPYGSWYVTGFLMEKPLAELRTDLKRFGFEVQEGVCEPEDHVAALCETMSLIAASPDIPFEAQREFFRKHVDTWMGRFFGDLASAQTARFYRSVGLLGERFLAVERMYFSMLV